MRVGIRSSKPRITGIPDNRPGSSEEMKKSLYDENDKTWEPKHARNKEIAVKVDGGDIVIRDTSDDKTFIRSDTYRTLKHAR